MCLLLEQVTCMGRCSSKEMLDGFFLEGSMERQQSPAAVKSHVEQHLTNGVGERVEVMDMAQIRRLVRLLDRSDVSELEITCASEDVHLVLRKNQAPAGVAIEGTYVQADSQNGAVSANELAAADNLSTVVAPLVGVFHPWLKPRGASLVAVGDQVKAGQIIGTIESLNVLNEVETAVAGRVVEIHVQDGQPVEYGQVLLTIESLAGEGA